MMPMLVSLSCYLFHLLTNKIFLGETHKFGCVAFKSTDILTQLTEYWKPETEDEELELKEEFYASTAVSTLFNWLNGQAHCLGINF